MDISVVIPLYNHEKYIEQTIDSVLDQTVKPKEIIIIDDGSQDSSLEKAQGYAKKYPDLFTVIGQKNRGAHATINRGILMAKSELISILNSDDNYKQERFAQCVKEFAKDPSLSAIATGIEFIDQEGDIIENVPWYEDAVKFHYENREDFFLSLVNANFFMTTSNFIFKKEIIADIGLFADLRYAHDYDFFLNCIATGHKIIFHDTPLVQYRMHDSNTIREDLAKVLVETVCVIGKFLKFTAITGYKNQSNLPQLDTILAANNFSIPLLDVQHFESTEKNKLSNYYNSVYSNNNMYASLQGFFRP